jgi:hypothetical protein
MICQCTPSSRAPTFRSQTDMYSVNYKEQVQKRMRNSPDSAKEPFNSCLFIRKIITRNYISECFKASKLLRSKGELIKDYNIHASRLPCPSVARYCRKAFQPQISEVGFIQTKNASASEAFSYLLSTLAGDEGFERQLQELVESLLLIE